MRTNGALQKEDTNYTKTRNENSHETIETHAKYELNTITTNEQICKLQFGNDFRHSIENVNTRRYGN
jgi:hypothetical protein